jgi:putative membrane protein
VTIIRHIIRFIVAAFVLLIMAWLIPGLTIVGFWTAFLAALIIAGIGWAIEALLGARISPYSRGFFGFWNARFLARAGKKKKKSGPVG